MAARMSLTPENTADSAMNSHLKAVAVSRASVVLPTPGGPQKIDRSQARRDHQGGTVGRAFIGVSIGQERLEALLQCGRGCGVRGHQVHEARGNAGDFGMDGDQFGQELLGAERAESVSTLQLCQMQGHVAACWVRRLVKSALRPRPPGAGCKALNR